MVHDKFFVLPEQRNGAGHSKLHPHWDLIVEGQDNDLTLEEIIKTLPVPCSTGNLSEFIQRYSNPNRKVRVRARLPRRPKATPSSFSRTSKPVLASPSIEPSAPPPTPECEKLFNFKPGSKLTLKSKTKKA